MSYAIIISKSVQKQIDNLPNDVTERVIEKIQNLVSEPRPDGIVKLKGSDNEYRIRIGDYRVRYEIDDECYYSVLLFSSNACSATFFKRLDLILRMRSL
ncbi:MAG: type II toxin-antitoxin system RelE/ParE family toxin [Nostoc sp.]|uniref:type II toxin-antitoxin system RelE family toxin n=1 Tax=Nostoc sp. TaxID=1180 RepID=UPI002FF49264